MTGTQLRVSKNPAWLSIVRHSYEEFFQLVFCGITSVLLLALLAHLRVPPFVELHVDVVKHLVSLPVGLVLVAMFATTIPLLLVNFLASIVRFLAAQQLAILAFHMSCLWFGAQIATQFIAIDYRSNDLPALVVSALNALRCNFTVVAMSIASAVIARGAFEEHSTVPARLAQTAIAIGAMYFFYELLTAQNSSTKTGLALVSNSTTEGWGLLSLLTFAIIGIVSLQNVSDTEEFVIDAKGKEDALTKMLSDGNEVAKLLYPQSYEAGKLVASKVEGNPSAWGITVENKSAGMLTLTQNQKRKLAWQFIAKNGAEYSLYFSTQKGDAKDKTKLSVKTQTVRDRRIWKRFIQSVNGPPGLVYARGTVQQALE